MTRQEISLKEQRKLSHMILESIEKKHNITELAFLLARQRQLDSKMKDGRNNIVHHI